MNASDLNGKKIHFMGIGGIGMCALAEIAASRGAVVSGCDRAENDNTARLRKNGIEIRIGHDASHTDGIDRLIFTSAVQPNAPERIAAGVRGIRRGSFLAELSQSMKGVGICGTHGKTTTSTMTAHLFDAGGLNPTALIGGVVPAWGSNCKVGRSDWLVTELDESDGTFAEATLQIAVVTNIESEHMAHYKTMDKLLDAFGVYAKGVEKGGVLIACGECPTARKLFSSHAGKIEWYGFEKSSDWCAENLQACENETRFTLLYHQNKIADVTIPFRGEHNVLNCMAAITAASHAGIDAASSCKAMANCPGIERRMQKIGNLRGTPVYSDYAHHPTEVRAAMRSARLMCKGEILVAFEPHLYSRTRDYATDFADALSDADELILADIYPAREEPIDGVTSRLIANPLLEKGHNVTGPLTLEETGEAVRMHAASVELILFMGAGSIGELAHEVVD